MQLQQQLAEGKLARDEEGATVQIVLPDGSVYPLAGHLLFTDLTVDPATGDVLLRASVPNPKHTLLPGLFVRARLTQAQIDNAILLPQQAVTRGNAAGDIVMTVGADGAVAPRPVKIAGQQDGQWIVTSGLKPGDQVLVEGVMKLMGAKTVKPVPWQPRAAHAPGAPAPAASGAGNAK
jgi:membrane fusion protein (multidrug efflux system)